MIKRLSDVDKIIVYGVLFHAIRMTSGAIASVYMEQRGMNIAEIGTLRTAQAIVIFALDIPLSYVADRLSRKWAVIGSVFLGIIWLALMGYAQTITLIYVAELFNALSLILIFGALTSYLIDVAKQNNPEQNVQNLLGRFQKHSFRAVALSGFFGAIFIKTDSATIWYVGAVLLTILLITLSHTLPQDTHKQDMQQLKFWHDMKIVMGQFRQLFTNTRFAIPSLILMTTFYLTVINYWTLLLANVFTRYREDGFVYGIAFLFVLGIQSFAGQIAEKRTSAEAIKLSFWINFTALLTLIIALAYIPYISVIAIVIMFGGISLFRVCLASIIHEQLDREYRATIDSIISSSSRFLVFGIMPLTGFAIYHFGWYALASIYALFIILCLVFRRLDAR